MKLAPGQHSREAGEQRGRNHDQGDPVRAMVSYVDHARELGLKRTAVGEPGERVMLRQVSDALGFAFPQ